MPRPFLAIAFAVASLVVCAGIAKPDPAATIEDYRQWTKVNREPQVMSRSAMTLCTNRIPQNLKSGPHEDRFVSVFVNAQGKKPFLTQRSPTFPTGTVIVKEKLTTYDSKKPELLTAMLKREKGYDPKHGDWEYLVLDSGLKIEMRGRLKSCQSCHDAQKNKGYLFRDYLTLSQQRALK